MSLSERTRAWIDWFGIGRLLVSALSVAVVCAGAWFLVRSPPPPSEASLPRATSAPPGADSGVSTLPPPSTVEPVLSLPSSVFVHVAGAVASPGVYELPAGSRVQRALDAAGGAAAIADTDVLNLAAIVADGTRVYVPEEGEVVPTSDIDDGSSSAVVPAGPLDANVATKAELESLPGIGPATAAAIVTERERNGPFLNVDDLERVPGIGPAKLDRIRDLVVT
jgi:competence protein ComEA